jgi:mannose-6-phosphate isomerase-like protein (cupin superfamily)
MKGAAMPAGEQQKEPIAFKYVKPELARDKTIARLCRTDIMYASVQVIAKGGENNMHAHSAQDGFWMVLKGRAKFYGEGDKLIAELGPNEGVLVPRGVQYWFESSSPEVLEILQVEAIDKTIKNMRIDYKPRVAGRENNNPDNLNEYTHTLKA